MSNFEPPQPEPSRPSPRARSEEDFAAFAERETTSTEREGLPSTYRMRADHHYVDQIVSRSAGLPVRLIAVNRIDAPGPVTALNLDALAKSIAAHGIVQPLIVRSQQGRYQVIAGRKRLAAAVVAGLAEVPCLLQQVGDSEAAALAAAENLRGTFEDPPAAPAAILKVDDLLQNVAHDLGRIASSAVLLRTTPNDGFPQRGIALDLIEAQAWRSAWAVRAAGLVLGGRREKSRSRSIASLIDRVVDGFEPERRLTGLELKTTVLEPLPVTLEEQSGELALTAAILITLTLVQGMRQPVLEVRAEVPQPGSVLVEVAQRDAPVSAEMSSQFSSAVIGRRGNLTMGLGAATLKAVTAQYGGAAELVVDDDRGSAIRCTFPSA